MKKEFLPLICLECHRIPLISKGKSKNITIQCSCGIKNVIPLKKYFELIESIKENVQINNSCVKHEKKEFSNYCATCNANICESCLAEHQKHKIIPLSIPLNLQTINKKATAITETINQTLNKIITHKIEYYKQEIYKQQLLLQNIKEKNDSFLLFINSLINTSTKYGLNFNAISNLLTFTNFNNWAPKNYDDESMMKYFKTFSIIKDVSLSVNDIKNKLIKACSDNIQFKYYKNEILYIGGLNDKKKEGFGICYCPNKQKHVGQFIKDVRAGYGTLYFPNGNRYEGEWKANKKDGYGIYYYSNGDKYEGQWEKNKKNGLGKITYKDKTVFIGEWINDLKNGYGIEDYSNRDKYLGKWKNNLKDGLGVYYFSNGNIYQGQFKEGYREGYGIYHYLNGDKYKGYWVNDKKEGYCIVLYSNNDKYIGQIINDKREGYGIINY